MRNISFLSNELHQIHASVQRLYHWQKNSQSYPQRVKTPSHHFLKEAEQILGKLTAELKPLVHAVQSTASFWYPLAAADSCTEPSIPPSRSLVYTRK